MEEQETEVPLLSTTPTDRDMGFVSRLGDLQKMKTFSLGLPKSTKRGFPLKKTLLGPPQNGLGCSFGFSKPPKKKGQPQLGPLPTLLTSATPLRDV